jgi:(2Fe-2S) ferredoxin
MKGSERIRYRAQILVCTGKKCSAKSDPEAAKKYFKERIKDAGLKGEVRACTCSCLDYCDDAPNIVVQPEGTLYKGVDEQDWEKIFRKHVLGENKP